MESKSKAVKVEIDREEPAAGQAFFVAIIRCVDSRVAREICFDQRLRSLFVCAFAGNIPTTEGIASLEPGVAVLGAKPIVMMGQSGCGAVDAAIKHRDETSVRSGSLPGPVNQILSPRGLPVDPEDPDASRRRPDATRTAA